MQLRESHTTMEGIVSSFVTTEYAEFAAKKIAAGLNSAAAINIQLIDSFSEAIEQEEAFVNYMGELREQVRRLEDEIARTQLLLSAEEARLRHVIKQGVDRFCANKPPVAVADEANAQGRKVEHIPVLRNDSDPENLGIRLIGIERAIGGRAEIYDNGTPRKSNDDVIRFTAYEGFRGPATVTYAIVDDLGLQDSATVTIHVSRVAPKVSYSPESAACKIIGTC